MMATKTITRADLVSTLNDEVGLSPGECAKLLDNVLDKITDALVKDGKIKINAFASFTVRQKKERIGRNPTSGEEVPISPRKVIIFRPSQKLRLRMNQPDDSNN